MTQGQDYQDDWTIVLKTFLGPFCAVSFLIFSL